MCDNNLINQLPADNRIHRRVINSQIRTESRIVNSSTKFAYVVCWTGQRLHRSQSAFGHRNNNNNDNDNDNDDTTTTTTTTTTTNDNNNENKNNNNNNNNKCKQKYVTVKWM